MSDNTSLCIIACTIVIFLALAAMGGCYMTETTKREMLKAGYSQVNENGVLLWKRTEPK